MERAESLFAIRAAAPGARARPGGDRPELPGQARHGDGERPRRRPRRPRRHHRRRAPGARARRCALQAPPNLVGDEFALMLRAGIDDWGGVSPVTPTTSTPSGPGPPSTSSPPAPPRPGSRSASGSRPTRSTCWPGSPWIDARLRAHVARAGRARVWSGWRGRRGGRPAVAGARRRVRVPGRIDLNTSIDSDRAHRRPARRLRRRSTATGTSWRQRAGRASSRSRRERLDADVRAGLAWPRPIRRAARPGPPDARWPDPRRRDRRWRRWPGSPTTAPRRRRRRGHLRRSTATSTSPTSATWAAGSARSPSASATPTRTGSRSTRSPTARSRRRGTAPPRSACRAASTRSCR